MAKVLIIGASRGIGRETLKQALAAGHEVRALARAPEKLPGDNPNLTVISGDATDPACIANAIAGMDAVIMTLGVSNPFSIRPVTLFSRATRFVVEAMRRTNVRRLIAVTGLGAGDSRGKGGLIYTKIIFPLVLSGIYEDKDVQEQFIRDSGLDWTIVRPGILTNDPMSGRYRAVKEPEKWGRNAISRADVADFLVRQIDDRSYIHQTPILIQ